ncbi:hypothetical protein Dd703_1986 [Musicola paradisiaca Ech703]|uniref:Uncharacterized protein n=1 Tax=Musicola paradisiaca (strain Ech703) TaxID=579405 RepID=C6C5Y5_MUSP7|nr:hypothetical protein Dd703_1986 [Musicola paradisiaca Ech703]
MLSPSRYRPLGVSCSSGVPFMLLGVVLGCNKEPRGEEEKRVYVVGIMEILCRYGNRA